MNFSKLWKTSTAVIVLVFNLSMLPTNAQNIQYKGKNLATVDSLRKVNIYAGFIGHKYVFGLLAEKVMPINRLNRVCWLLRVGVGYRQSNASTRNWSDRYGLPLEVLFCII